MARHNKLLEALSDYDNDLGLNRSDLRDAIADLSAEQRKRRIRKRLDISVSRQIFNFFIGLILLSAILVILFIAGNRYLFEKNNTNLKSIIPTSWENNITDFFSNISFKNLKSPIQKSSLDTIPYLKTGENYYVQIAICRLQKCNNLYVNKARKLEYPYNVVTEAISKKNNFKEIISARPLSLQRAQNLVDFINTVNDRSGYANIVPTAEGKFYVSLGSFPDEAVAEDLRRYYENLVSSEAVRFEYKESYMFQSGNLSRILIGPFQTKNKVLKILPEIRQAKGLENSFIVAK